ncbi:hypothetical protein J4N42_00965 [Vibrio sp. SCSIO 43135]|uniref:hypothetical protein n=1 Tax=Vibrio sp. SCSIO 43135 TaxID=2819096 RepID=UPI0020763DD7|nr:hypothetical protein [Vibrio sp. SCSIO 43135]USD41334.1 hypothetical protein J4N42_00965 [Vibrio sp. SCSIO 43135]
MNDGSQFSADSLLNAVKHNGYYESSGIVNNVYYRCKVTDLEKPLVVCFANAGKKNIASLEEAKSLEYSPWGFEYISSKKDLNVISFSCIGEAMWYRDVAFIAFLESQVTRVTRLFSRVYGYGGSMGGYAVATFQKLLNMDRVLLLNPISTLNSEVVPWEKRFSNAQKNLDWSSDYSDSALNEMQGYVIYDPLFSADKRHADRYRGLKKLKIPGVGHKMPLHLKNLKMLSWVFDSFLNDSIDEKKFNKMARKRRNYINYYKWLLSKQNTHISPIRRSIILRHYKAHQVKEGDNFNKMTRDEVDMIRDSAVLLEDVDIEYSYKLMMIAKKLRPKGKFISSKLSQYRRTLSD